MGVPRVPGGAQIGVSSAGDVEEHKPPSLWTRSVLIPFAVVATAFYSVYTMTDLGFLLLWAAIGICMLGLIYKSWRR